MNKCIFNLNKHTCRQEILHWYTNKNTKHKMEIKTATQNILIFYDVNW